MDNEIKITRSFHDPVAHIQSIYESKKIQVSNNAKRIQDFLSDIDKHERSILYYISMICLLEKGGLDDKDEYVRLFKNDVEHHKNEKQKSIKLLSSAQADLDHSQKELKIWESINEYIKGFKYENTAS